MGRFAVYIDRVRVCIIRFTPQLETQLILQLDIGLIIECNFTLDFGSPITYIALKSDNSWRGAVVR